MNIHQDIPLCNIHNRHLLNVLRFVSPVQRGTEAYWKSCPIIFPFSLGYFVFPDSKCGRLPPLFIRVFGSMDGKSERSKIQAYHGRLSAVAFLDSTVPEHFQTLCTDCWAKGLAKDSLAIEARN